jgi:hypothetical protein
MYQTSEDYLLDQLKHYSEAVIDFKRNSIGTRPSSSQATGFCPSLLPDCTTDPNSNIVLKAGILQEMLSIKSKFSIDKITSGDVMSVADSVQECVKFDHASNEPRSSPRNFISKIDKLTHCDHIADVLSIDGLEGGLGTSLGGRARSESVSASCAVVGWALSIGLIDLPFSHWTHVTFKHLSRMGRLVLNLIVTS